MRERARTVDGCFFIKLFFWGGEVVASEAFLELLDAAGGVDEFLLAGVVGV